jgi:hypothetical protein
MTERVGKSFFVEVFPRSGEFSGRTSPLLDKLPNEVGAVEYDRGTLRIFFRSESESIPSYLRDMFEGFSMKLSKHED